MAHDPVIVVLNDWGSVTRALETAGGAIAVEVDRIADLKELLQYADAMVLTGGSDIEPSRYKAEKHPRSGGFAQARDKLEFEAVKLARKHRLPMMGICRGHQLLNVAFGGTLIQHLDDQAHVLYHESTSHYVNVREDSQIGAMWDGGIKSVTSLHHQAVERMGDGLVPVGWADDGTVEMLESAPGVKPYVLGTQFHPEMDYKQDPQAEDIFAFFVDKVRTRARGRGKFQKRRDMIREIMDKKDAREAAASNAKYSNYTWGVKERNAYTNWPSSGRWDDDLPDPVVSQWDDDWSLLDAHARNAYDRDVNEVLDMQDWRELNDEVLAELNKCQSPPCVDPRGCATYGDCEKELISCSNLENLERTKE